jgi:hypothetical protein
VSQDTEEKLIEEENKLIEKLIEDFFAKRNEVREQLESVSIHVAETTDELTSQNNANELLDILEELDGVVDEYVRKNNDKVVDEYVSIINKDTELKMPPGLSEETNLGYKAISDAMDEEASETDFNVFNEVVNKIIPKRSKEIFFFKFLSKLTDEQFKEPIADLMDMDNTTFLEYADNVHLNFTNSDSELTYDDE